jgi:DNA-binding IscR family transcriptional regulator
LSRSPREISVGDLIRRLEGRLTVRQSTPASELSPGEVAVHLINDKLTEATNEVLDAMSLEQLLEHVNRASSSQQEMYYI